MLTSLMQLNKSLAIYVSAIILLMANGAFSMEEFDEEDPLRRGSPAKMDMSEKIKDFLSLSYQSIPITEADKRFAKELAPFLLDISKFKTLSEQEKQELGRKFFIKLSCLNVGTFGDNYLTQSHELTSNFCPRYREFVKEFNGDHKEYIEENFDKLMSKRGVSEGIIKAVIINVIKTNASGEWVEFLEELSLIDLAEKLKEQFQIPSSELNKWDIAFSGAPWVELSARNYWRPALLWVVAYTAGLICALIIDPEKYAQVYAGPLIPAFFLVFLYGSYNYWAYREAARHNSIGCQLF
jgi:hypothetical protein